uniref:Uncharacterized protein n=1 Tax=Anguilla anguilla TaxID=7936 RepID=A0A0E9SCH2_ANGAN
MAFSLIKLL